MAWGIITTDGRDERDRSTKKAEQAPPFYLSTFHSPEETPPRLVGAVESLVQVVEIRRFTLDDMIEAL
jgi:hypothetical protein